MRNVDRYRRVVHTTATIAHAVRELRTSRRVASKRHLERRATADLLDTARDSRRIDDRGREDVTVKVIVVVDNGKDRRTARAGTKGVILRDRRRIHLVTVWKRVGEFVVRSVLLTLLIRRREEVLPIRYTLKTFFDEERGPVDIVVEHHHVPVHAELKSGGRQRAVDLLLSVVVFAFAIAYKQTRPRPG